MCLCIFFFSSRRRHTRCSRDWSSDVCSSDLDGDCLFQKGPRFLTFVHGQIHNRQQKVGAVKLDRKSTRLNSSHGYISYAVFCLKKKKKKSSHHAQTANEANDSMIR